MKPKQSLYRHRFTHFTDALIPIYNRLFAVQEMKGECNSE